MDIVQINKMTQKKKVRSAENHLYNLGKITKYDATILVVNAVCKEYGIFRTADIIHGLGVDKIKA